jgi:hypothetical protein
VVQYALVVAIVLGATASARAQPGPFFEPDALLPQGYELRVSAAYHDVERTDMSRPIFLYAQPLERVRARELVVSLELRLSITPNLAVQLVLPWLVRSVDARTIGLQVNRDRELAPRTLELSSWGLGDPLLALAYRLFHERPWGAYAELGATIPIDDNSGSAVLPARAPLSTGQHELFLGAGATLERPIALSLSYRFSFCPGEHAAYLIRRTGTQSYTSGAFAAYMRQRVQASAELSLSRLFSVLVAPAWTMTEVPFLVDRNVRRRVVSDSLIHELDLGAAVRVQLDRHRIELRYTVPLVTSYDIDPFFPIEVPKGGIGVAWQLTGS